MGLVEMIMASLSLLLALGGVGVLVYLVFLLHRLVRAVEKIAENQKTL
jgi:hypothetical protein